MLPNYKCRSRLQFLSKDTYVILNILFVTPFRRMEDAQIAINFNGA
jgi:hypothetical protein